MVGCSAVGCSNNSKNGDWSFHRLPKKKELHKKWLQAMKRVDIAEGQNVVLCSAHFVPEDFKRDLKVSVGNNIAISLFICPKAFFDSCIKKLDLCLV